MVELAMLADGALKKWRSLDLNGNGYLEGEEVSVSLIHVTAPY